MPKNFALSKEQLWSLRQLLKLGLGGVGLAGAGALWYKLNAKK
jgi:manganese oxidase